MKQRIGVGQNDQDLSQQKGAFLVVGQKQKKTALALCAVVFADVDLLLVHLELKSKHLAHYNKEN
jgi:hypothetical protein